MIEQQIANGIAKEIITERKVIEFPVEVNSTLVGNLLQGLGVIAFTLCNINAVEVHPPLEEEPYWA